MTVLDFSNSFAAHPDNGNLLVRSGKSSIQQSLANLLMTEKYERPFQPTIGTKIRSLLFEPVTPSTANTLKSLITETVENEERRVRLEQVVVHQERDRYNVSLIYYFSGERAPTTQRLTLTRIR